MFYVVKKLILLLVYIVIICPIAMKILHTNSKDVVEECQRYFGFLPVSHRIVICSIY